MDATRYSAQNYRLLEKYIKDMEPRKPGSKTYKKYSSEVYLRLVFEYLYYSDHRGRPVYSIAHYDELNGDLMRDPEITFSVDFENGQIEPLSYQNDYVGVYVEIYRTRDQRLYWSKKARADTDEFLHTWLRNLQKQDHQLDE